jgi:hypothetical protein
VAFILPVKPKLIRVKILSLRAGYCRASLWFVGLSANSQADGYVLMGLKAARESEWSAGW